MRKYFPTGQRLLHRVIENLTQLVGTCRNMATGRDIGNDGSVWQLQPAQRARCDESANKNHSNAGSVKNVQNGTHGRTSQVIAF